MRKDINLLPDKYRNVKHRRRIQRTRKAILAAAILTAAAAVYLPAHMVNSIRNVSASVENQIAGRKYVANYRRMQEELQREIEKRNSIIEQLNSNALKWSGLIEEISGQVPEGVALQSVSHEGKDSVNIIGQAVSYKAVAQFMVNLQNMTAFRQVAPAAIAREESGLYGFEIMCIIRSGSDKDETQ